MVRQLKSLSVEAVESILSWPLLLMDEGRGDEAAHVRRITSMRDSDRRLTLTIERVSNTPPLTNDLLWRLRDRLDIGEFEFSRNHLAVKHGELLSLLSTAGHSIPSHVSQSFEEKSLPYPDRAVLMTVKAALELLGQSELDNLLLEAGIGELPGNTSTGSRRDRANAIVSFALDNPGAVTADNHLFGAFLIRKLGVTEADARRATNDVGTHAAVVPTATPESRSVEPKKRSPNRVFVVHGQDERAREELVAFLRTRGLEAVVLHDQPNMGRHLLTKFIDEAELATFAVVLMTADDVGRLASQADLRPRARQNVILELGYFLAHLGQPRVCALVSPGLETPSDFDGIVYIRMDVDRRWERELERELRAAEMPLVSAATGGKP